MPLIKSKGNMYPWVTHMHTHLGGECAHKCRYCYVDNPRFGRHPKYQGPIRLIEDELKVKYGTGKVIFIEHCNDLLAKDVPAGFITRIIEHCMEWHDGNTFVFQTKNPERYQKFAWPKNSLFGTTIETDDNLIGVKISEAPLPFMRYVAMADFAARKFVTIEPILDFNVDRLSGWIRDINPEFVNIGASSKPIKFREPTSGKIRRLLGKLQEYGIPVKVKHNLERLMTNDRTGQKLR